jgi:hypothetical protein
VDPPSAPNSSSVDVVAEYRGIRFTATHAALLDDGRETVRIPLAQIRSLTLQHGFTSARPLLGVALGMLSLFLGWRVVERILAWLRDGGTIWDYEIILIFLLPLGAWLVRDMLRRGPYLVAELDNGRRKLPFDAALDSGFVEFAQSVEKTTGHRIHHHADAESFR